MLTPAQATPADYERLGLRAGLEIHQQLHTERKLFCRCPAGRYSPRFDAEILRHMRPTLSELGEYDPTALMEFKTRKEILYRLNRETVCTYEMDDAPPFALNEQALDIALEVTLLLGCKVVGELHIARKQYLDGSIPTGFQRTTILGVDGSIPFGPDRTIGIRQLGLEEDSCREVEDRGHRRTYMTDRLSIPLIELVTEPDMRTPREVAEVAEILRRLCRLTGKVRRGHGSARQDVNVSVAGGTRCEIKGVHSIRWIPALVHYEALRQKALLDVARELRRRGLTPDDVVAGSRVVDVTTLVRHSLLVPLREAVLQGAHVLAVRLPSFRGILTRQTGPHNRFEREFVERVRVIACLDGQPNLVHSETPESLAPRLWDKVQQALGASEQDAVVLVWGPARDVQLGADEIVARAREAALGVPSETRQARPDGSTGFERLLPGPNRMYPDTDLPPIALTESRVQRVRSQLPETPWQIDERLAGLGVNADMRLDLLRSRRLPLFDRLVREAGAPPVVACAVLTQTLKHRARGWQPLPADERLVELFRLFVAGRFFRELWPAVLAQAGRQADCAVEDLPALQDEPLADPTAVRSEVARLLAPGQWGGPRRPGQALRAAIGHVMEGGLRGRAPGRFIVAAVEEQLRSTGRLDSREEAAR